MFSSESKYDCLTGGKEGEQIERPVDLFSPVKELYRGVESFHRPKADLFMTRAWPMKPKLKTNLCY